MSELKDDSRVTTASSIMPEVTPAELRTRIEKALKRSAEGKGRKIRVAVRNGRIILSGNVHSLSEIEDATLVAWGASGALSVDNRLKLVA